MMRPLLFFVMLAGLGGSGVPAAPAAPEEKSVSWDAMLALVRTRFPKVAQLGTAELDAWLKDPKRPKPQVLDAREPAEFAVSHLAGAVRVSPDATAKEILASLDTSRPIVIYCSVGYRSSRLATRLLESGRVSVFNLEGSIFTWANEGRPLVTRDDKATTVVHPFDSVYGRLLKPECRAP
jgi:rhodanese-related sulfurtransferase